jgi:hypothetical protein
LTEQAADWADVMGTSTRPPALHRCVKTCRRHLAPRKRSVRVDEPLGPVTLYDSTTTSRSSTTAPPKTAPVDRGPTRSAASRNRSRRRVPRRTTRWSRRWFGRLARIRAVPDALDRGCVFAVHAARNVGHGPAVLLVGACNPTGPTSCRRRDLRAAAGQPSRLRPAEESPDAIRPARRGDGPNGR